MDKTLNESDLKFLEDGKFLFLIAYFFGLLRVGIYVKYYVV
jgi:hypothetical protein